MWVTLMFSVVATKSRTFPSFSYPADEQVRRSWEGAQPGRQAELANGNIPYHKHHSQFINGGWLGSGSYWLFLVSMSFFESSHGQEFELFYFFQAANWSLSGEKKIVYRLFCIFIIIIVIISNGSTLLSYSASLSQPMSFPFCPFLLIIQLEGKERSEQAAV